MKCITYLIALLPFLISCGDSTLDMHLSNAANKKIDIYESHLDLDEVGTIEQIRLDNPTHYRLINRIQNEVPPYRLTKVEIWLRTGYRLDDFYISKLMKTSYPPKRKLFFTLDKIRYSMTVTDQPYSAHSYYVDGSWE